MKKKMKFPAIIMIIMSVLPVSGQVTLSVDTVRTMALEHSYKLRQDRNSIAKSDLDIDIARRQRLPMLDASAMALITKDMEIMEGTTLQMRGMYTAGLNLSLPIYAGGQLSAGLKLAKIGREVARLNSMKTRAEVISDADNSYYTLLAIREKERMLQAYMRQIQAIYDQVSLSVKNGMALQDDLLRVEARMSDIKYQMQKVSTGASLCSMALCNAVGLPLNTEIVLADSALTAEAPANLDYDISRRPETGLLRQQVAASEQQVKMKKAGYLPTVAIAGGISWFGNIRMKGTTMLPDGTPYQYTQKFDDYMPLAMLSVSIPVCHWGTEVKKVRQAKIELENSRLALEENTRLMDIEARQAVCNLIDGHTLVETSLTGLRQSEKSLESMRARFKAGFATLTDVLDAEAQWSQARANHIEALAQQKINHTEYLRVTGRL